MDAFDKAFGVFLGLLAAWMGWFDYAQPADQVAREFLYVLGGFAGLYLLIRRWMERR